MLANANNNPIHFITQPLLQSSSNLKHNNASLLHPFQQFWWRRSTNHASSSFLLSHSPSRCSSSSKRSTVVVRANYTRKPTGTPGAYQLIDNETGEKFIVWGGIEEEEEEGGNGDNDSAMIPSREILSWKPSDSKRASSSSTTRSSAGGSVAPSRGISGSFGKLKAQRVRSLARKTYRMKQEIKDNEDNEGIVKDNPFDGSISSHLGPESLLERKRLDFFKKGRKSVSSSDSMGTTDTMLDDASVEHMAHLEVTTKYEGQELSNQRSKPTNSSELDINIAGADVSGSRVSATSSRREWRNAESVQNFRSRRTDIPKQLQKVSADSDFFSPKSFGDLGCSPDMIESLRKQHFIRPSRIQAMTFAPVSGGKSCIIADQSGSGKTLSYLIPVIQRLRHEELQGISKSSSQNPRVVILVPTAELASQVLSNCRSLSKSGIPFRSMVATGGFRQKTQLETLKQDLDVLIATPGRFIYLIKEGFLQLTNLRCAVLDEVDILFKDEEFESALQSLISSSPVTAQYLFVTATLPLDIYNKTVELFPDCEVIMGPGMHRTSSGLEEILVDCSGDDGAEKTPDTAFSNKKSALLQLVEENPVAKTIVFCNKIETCRKVENALKRFDKNGIHIRVLPFHAALAQESRLGNMEEFCNFPLKDNNSLFLVCTDRASRGIDFTGVDHVVLFDYPRDPSEYVRRVGRTARGAGGKGKAFLFVVGKQVSLARRIIERNRKGHPLHDVPTSHVLY